MSYVKGEVSFKLYNDIISSYSVLKVKISETDIDVFKNYSTCSVTGYFSNIEIGATYTFKGRVVNSKKYGNTFVSETYERVLPSNAEGLIEFLSGDGFKGIGKKTATLIVEKLGEDCIKLILDDIRVLDGIKGLTDLKKQLLYEKLEETRGLEEILVTLYSYGLTPKISMKIYDTYKTDTLNVVKNTPYRLIEDIEGVAFLKADKIALQTGINPKSEARIEACIKYILLNYSLESGDTYLSKEQLIEKTNEYLGFSHNEKELIENSISNLLLKNEIIFENDSFSDSSIYHSERYIAKKLKLIRDYPKDKIFAEEIYRLLENLEKEMNIKYEDTQKSAIYNALTNNVSIITGGPGTGKTTIEKGIIYCFNQLVESNLGLIKLCAPTGKAAKRIEESTKYSALTIHRTLGYDVNGYFTYDATNQLNAKIVVIDEASMVDVYLFRSLLEAIPQSCKVVIVGDSDQLPSIGPGQVLKDLIDSKIFVTTKLTKIHRQKENSKIISLAYDILDEEIKTEIDESHDELSIAPCSQVDLFDTLVNTVKHFLGLGYNLLDDIQVLVPIYKGGVGIDQINRYLQSIFNSNYNEEFEVDPDNYSYFLDDKVIQLVNQYEDDVMNGDMGYVADFLDKKEIVVNFQGRQVKYKGQDIQNIQLAYAISIHKSQGSEFKVVILPIFPQYRILMNKKLLYTAVTRAKEHLVLVGDLREISRAIRTLSVDRKTRIKEFLN